MMVKFCPKCHREAYRLVENDGHIEIVQGGKTLIKTDKASTVSMSVNCPSGHPVKLEVGKNG